jgi:signal transduction histidine kinase
MQPSQSFTAIQGLGVSGFNEPLLQSDQQQSLFSLGPSSLEGARLAHDAGNLLGALSLYAELLASPGVLSKRYRSYANEIKILADRSNALIERLAGYRRDSARMPEKVVLPNLIENYSGLLTAIIGRPIEIVIGPLSDQTLAVSNEVVERVLLNLAKNAASATPPSGNITIAVEGGRTCHSSGQGHVLMTVTDEGSGMSREKLRTLFESAPSKDGTGRGLGLQIVRELVEGSGGHLEIQSHPGRGTKASVKWFTRRIDAA